MRNYFVEGETFFHRLDPRIKIYWSIVISILIMLLDNVAILSFIFISCLIPWIFVPFRMISSYKKLFIIVILIVIGKSISQSMFYKLEPRTSILTIINTDFPVLGSITGGINVYYEGFFYGARNSIRFLSALFLGIFIIRTTHFSDMILALRKLRIPYKISFGLSITYRFLPLMFSEFNRILTAQKLRGFRNHGLLGKLKSLKISLPPLIIGLLQRSHKLALAAEVRAFTTERTNLKELKFSKLDMLAFIILTFYLIAGFAAYYFGYGAIITIG